MRVLSDKHVEVVRHYRTIEIEDGPTVDCGGDSKYDSYYPGTLITVDKLKLEWVGDEGPSTIEVSGPYIGTQNSGPRRYNKRYRTDELPDWIKEILQ